MKARIDDPAKIDAPDLAVVPAVPAAPAAVPVAAAAPAAVPLAAPAKAIVY